MSKISKRPSSQWPKIPGEYSKPDETTKLRNVSCSYKKRIEDVRSIAFDQPMVGLEKVVWWTEYVLRHRGAPHLRSALADVSLTEYLLLDVLFVFLIVLLTVLFVLYKVSTSLINVFRPQKVKRHKKNN